MNTEQPTVVYLTPMADALVHVYGKLRTRPHAAHWADTWNLFFWLERNGKRMKIHGVDK